MHITRLFKSGNSQAVQIPADLAYERSDIELEIERVGDEIRIDRRGVGWPACSRSSRNSARIS